MQVHRERDLQLYKALQVNYEKLQYKNFCKESEVEQVKKILNQTMEIKLQYETVLQELMDNDPQIVGRVLNIIKLKKI